MPGVALGALAASRPIDRLGEMGGGLLEAERRGPSPAFPTIDRRLSSPACVR
jgi:hypothetical protein